MIGENQLRKLVDGAFDWILRNLDLFDPFVDGIKPDPLRSKAIAELAFMCEYYYRATGHKDDRRLQTMVRFIWDVWQRPQYRELIVRNPEGLQLYMLIYDSLRGCGLEDPSSFELIQRVIDEGYALAVEVVPFRKLDLRHVLDHGGFKHDLPSYAELYKETLLAKTPSLLYLTDGDIYCITHTLFYLADFGFRPIDAISQAQLIPVCWMVGSLLGLYLRLRDWDLTAELLLSCLCLRWTPPIVIDAAWDALVSAQVPDGSIPAPRFGKEKFNELDQAEWKVYAFEQNYHTTLVGALSAFMMERLAGRQDVRG